MSPRVKETARNASKQLRDMTTEVSPLCGDATVA